MFALENNVLELEALTPGALPEVDAFEEYIKQEVLSNGKTEKTD